MSSFSPFKTRVSVKGPKKIRAESRLNSKSNSLFKRYSSLYDTYNRLWFNGIPWSIVTRQSWALKTEPVNCCCFYAQLKQNQLTELQSFTRPKLTVFWQCISVLTICKKKRMSFKRQSRTVKLSKKADWSPLPGIIRAPTLKFYLIDPLKPRLLLRTE